MAKTAAKKAKNSSMTADQVLEELKTNEDFFWWAVKPKAKKSQIEVVVGVQSENKKEKPSYYSGTADTVGEAYEKALEAYEAAS